MDMRALEFVAPYCDLGERLRDVPGTAVVRGVMFDAVKSALQDADKLDAYCAMFGPLQYQSLTLYPLGEYMLRLASAGAVLLSPARVYEGIGLISHLSARELARGLLGKTLIHALASDPRSLLEQGLAMRRQVLRYGRWEMVHQGPRDIEVFYTDELVWIEASHHEAAKGTFDACNIKPNIVTTLTGPYSGSTRFQW
jgi:uncharacterized protein (TIGR02265 family)